VNSWRDWCIAGEIGEKLERLVNSWRDWCIAGEIGE